MDDVLSPVRIDPDAIYNEGQARLLLGLTSAAMTRARRLGRLRFARPGRNVLYRGRWLLDWLDDDTDWRSHGTVQEAQPCHE